MLSNPDLKSEAQKLNVILSAGQLSQIGQFCSLLFEFNQHTNLIANCDATVLMRDHILDSLALLPIAKGQGQPKTSKKLIDIGSGGGLPGLVLAIADPSLRVVLVEAIGKKSRFLSDAVSALELASRVSVLNIRAEVLAHQSKYRNQFDYATARAVGSLAIVLELTLPFLKIQGLGLIQKSAKQCREEAEIAGQAAGILKAKLLSTVYTDAGVLGKERGVLVFEQLGKAPMLYPRAWAKLKKEPIYKRSAGCVPCPLRA